MNKKIIIAAVLILAVTVLFAACKKENEYEVSYTVEVGTTTVEVYKDKDGNEYVKNIDGDMVPVTRDSDGFYDSMEGLLTETTTKKDDGASTENSSSSTTTTTTSPSSSADTTTSPSSSADTTTEPQGIDFDSGKEDTVSWDEIVNAGKNQ